MFGDHITLLDGVVVCVFSMVVVFLVLYALTKMIDLTAWIIRKGEKGAGSPAPAKAAPAPAPTAPARPAAPAAPAAPARDVDAVLAAAAIAAYLGESPDHFVVRSIRRAAEEESPWVQVGRLNLTQP